MKLRKIDKRNNDAAAFAWTKAREDGAEALPWLMRAARLAPEDPRIALELAQTQLRQGNAANAASAFAALSKRYDIAAAWIGLALANLQSGQTQQAAEALDSMLTRHCLPDDPGFASFALHVAHAAGYGGFTGVTVDGDVTRQGQGTLLGSKPDWAALARIEGLAAWEKEGLAGWAARPAAPETPPELWLEDAAGMRKPVRLGKPMPPDDSAPFLPRYRFRLSPAQLRALTPPFSLRGTAGAEIFGSPVDPAALVQNPKPAKKRGRPPARIPRRARLALLMPVYRGLAQTRAALNSALAAAPKGAKLIVVDDCTPEPALARWLDRLAAEDRIILRRHQSNLGFCAAVNSGLTLAKGRDVLLLNADILLPPGAIETLAQVAYTHAATGTVTPLSNAATICSYPNATGSNEMPGARETARLNALAHEVNGIAAVEIPTAVGFCMFIRHDCLQATGGFRGEIFAQGYGEENDFCLRARHLGFRHMAAPGAYVAHEGGVSFRAAARGLMRRNILILNNLYPGYQALVDAHAAADPLAPYRARLDEARLLKDRTRKGAVLLISHSHGGGVARQVQTDLAQWRTQGFRPLLLTTEFPEDPEKTPYPWPSLLSGGDAETCPNLAFTLPSALPRLLALLRRLDVRRVVLHHSLGHHESVRGLAARLGVPQDIVVHDYASFCPRVNLLNRPDKKAPLRYCGEPGLAGCVACTKVRDSGVHERLPVAQLRARSAAEFAAAARVIVPSADAARRLRRHFPGLEPEIQPWEDDRTLPPLAPTRHGDRLRVVVIGGIGPAKGFDVLLDCAADAKARNLPLDFFVIGTSADDERLLAAGIFVTGPYQEGEVQTLIKSFRPNLAFLPSIWPETWCFTLGEAWRAGLRVVIFDLGAQADRMRGTGRGAAAPLGLPPQRINDLLSKLA
ncbi:MAG TPA: glycosyltransferase [Acidocella sp.]|jgi:GT2 family glycosyltransferase/glycosyltransferase involved in cell wall biosynthesis|nr:glycosyltransferase [Acidocella sp.]